MRTFVADKRCENGHFIDESWDLCPYCPAPASDADVPIVRPSRFSNAEGRAERPAPRTEPRVEPKPEPRPAAPSPEPRRPTAVPSPPPVPRRESIPSDPPPMDRTVAVQKVDPNSQAATKRYVVGWLVALSGPARGESYAIRIGRNILGRDKRSDVSINDDQASSHHADLVFRPEERRFILMDHNSTNGTYVNENEIEPRRDLVGRDVIRIGSKKFLFMPLVQDGFYWDDEGALK